MKKIVFLLSIITLLWINADAQLCCSYKGQVDYPIPSFYSLRKHPEIYSAKDRATLQSIYNQLIKEQKRYKCFVKHYKKYDNYKHLVNVGLKRYERRMQRENIRTQKYGNPFVNVALMDFLELDSIYSAKIIYLQEKTKLNDSVKYIIDGLKQDIQNLTFQIGRTKAQAISARGADKTNLFIKSIILNKKKIELKEDYIAFLLGDEQKLKQLEKRYKKLQPKIVVMQDTSSSSMTKKQQGQTTGDKGTEKTQKHYKRTTYYLFRIDQISQKLNLNAQELVWLSSYRNSQDSIQRIENLLHKANTKSRTALTTKLAKLYWKTFISLFDIYKNHLPRENYQQIYTTYDLSKKLHDKAIKTKDIYTLWQADHYLGQAVIMMENILADRFNITGRYQTSDILPSSAIAKRKIVKKGKQPTTKTRKAIHCTPSDKVYTYSIENPKPQLLRQTGTSYRVYVGTTTRQVLPQEFSDYQPITYRKICRDSRYREKKYYVGNFSTYDAAKKVANKLYTQYGIHTKVIKFINGKPAVGMPTPQPTPQPQTQTVAGIKNIHSTKYLVYVVRIGTYSEAKRSSQLKHLNRLYYATTDDGKYTYFDGPYYTYASAQTALRKLRSLGYQDAYIQAFNNGQKLSITRAKQIETGAHTQAQTIFGIQVGAYSQPLTQSKFQQIFGKLNTYYSVSMIRKGVMYVYYIHAGTTYNQAKQIKAKVKRLGYKDAFIIAIQNNKIVPLSSVVK